MGARRGPLSFTRFRVKGAVPKDLRRKFLDAVRLRLFVPLDVSDEAMESSGWCVVERPFDLEIHEGNLFFDRYVTLGFRVDKWRIPGALVKAQLEDEEQRLLGRSGREGRSRLGRAEKAELRQKIVLKLRRKIMPNAKTFDVLWDLDGETLLFFGHSAKVLLDFSAYFEKTFDLQLEEDCPYHSAMRSGLPSSLKKQLLCVDPLSLVSGHKRLIQAKKGQSPKAEPSTQENSKGVGDDLLERIETTRFLGSEFLLWIWLYGALIEDTVSLGKQDEWNMWLDGSLALQSVHDPSEKVSVSGAAPAASNEAREAVKNYKFPARAKVILRQEERDFKFILNASRFSISAGEIPTVLQEGDEGLLERLHFVNELLGLVDRLFAAFLLLRLSAHWQEAWEPAIAAWTDQAHIPPVILQALNKSVRELGRPKR